MTQITNGTFTFDPTYYEANRVGLNCYLSSIKDYLKSVKNCEIHNSNEASYSFSIDKNKSLDYLINALIVNPDNEYFKYFKNVPSINFKYDEQIGNQIIHNQVYVKLINAENYDIFYSTSETV